MARVASGGYRTRSPSPYTAALIIETACESDMVSGNGFVRPEFREALLRIAGEGRTVSSKRLGRWLTRIRGRVVDGHRLEVQVDGKRGNRFSLCAMEAR